MEWTSAVLFFTFSSLLVATSPTEVKAMDLMTEMLDLMNKSYKIEIAENKNKIAEILDLMNKNKIEIAENKNKIDEILDKMKVLDMSYAMVQQKQKLTIAKDKANNDAQNYIEALRTLMEDQMRYNEKLQCLFKWRCKCLQCEWKWQWLNDSCKWLNDSLNVLNQENLTEEEVDKLLRQEDLLEQDSQLLEQEDEMVKNQMKKIDLAESDLEGDLARNKLAKTMEENIVQTLKALDQAYQLGLETTVTNYDHHCKKLYHHCKKLYSTNEELKIHELLHSYLRSIDQHDADPNKNAEHQEKQNAQAGATGSKSKIVVAPLMAVSPAIAFLALLALYLHRRRQGIACIKGP